MSAAPRRYEIVSVSLPSELVKRANALIPKTRRSRVIAGVLTSFLDAIERGRVAEEYRAYYAQRTPREVKEERDLLAEWQVSDDEAWQISGKGGGTWSSAAVRSSSHGSIPRSALRSGRLGR